MVVHVSIGFRTHLFAHGVDAIRPQEGHCLFHQVCPSTVEHPETQVLFELGFNGHSVQLPGGTEAVVCPAEGRVSEGQHLRAAGICFLSLCCIQAPVKHLIP